MARILSREGASLRVSRFFFKAMVQAVLLFGSETWVVTPPMDKALGGFQAQLARRLRRWILRRTPYGKWIYTSAATAQEEAGLLTMEDYIRRSQKTVAQYIATRSLLYLCEGSERALGARLGIRWWEQVVLVLEGARETAAAATEGD